MPMLEMPLLALLALLALAMLALLALARSGPGGELGASRERVEDEFERQGKAAQLASRARARGRAQSEAILGALSAEQRRRFESELQAGRLIAAVKIIREVTGLGLAEAKALVDALRKQRGN